jgi:two-component system chemotaxis response regulator CheV
MVSLRGSLVPVVDLAKFAQFPSDTPRDVMIVTEYNGHTQGFLVESVDTILRLDWAQMRVPPAMLTANLGGLVTAVTELADNRLVMMLDVEKILSETADIDNDLAVQGHRAARHRGCHRLLLRRLPGGPQPDHPHPRLMGVRYVSAINGGQMWAELSKVAAYAESSGRKVSELISMILTDVEMPEMDGLHADPHIKADPRFAGIPVVMHSSLSSDVEPAARSLGRGG